MTEKRRAKDDEPKATGTAEKRVSVDADDSTYKPGLKPDESIVPPPGPSTIQELGAP